MSEEKAEESKEERRMVAIAIRPCEGVDAAALYTKIKAEIKSQVSLCTYRMSYIVAMVGVYRALVSRAMMFYQLHRMRD